MHTSCITFTYGPFGPKKGYELLEATPNGHKGKAQKKTEGSTKFCDQGSPGVDWHLGPHSGLIGDGPEGEGEVFRLE